MDDYKVGDCLIHLHSGQVFRIYNKFVNGFGTVVYSVENMNNNHFPKFSLDSSSISTLFDCGPVAQLLYTSNNNKAVTNETND